ncbi:MAG TPA: dienelactone hydrolase family protein [Candidatus Deferrimicrobium sp.]|nr:dienelactone hydrolase family protein [Candidatus Deferrimicrobium sp.]
MKTALFFVLTLMLAVSPRGEIVTKVIEYKHDEVVLEGFLAYDDAREGKRPGVLVIHEWTGLNDYIRMRARQLAELGYVALAVDMYGKGIRPQTSEEASKQAGTYRGDRKLMRDRVTAGLDVLRKHELCDNSRIAAIGYCFGGGTALELARSGADIAGVVSFHGNLDTPDTADAKSIKCKVLVCHGGDDPHVAPDKVQAFFDEMRNAGVDYQFIAYGGAVHSFTNPNSGDDPAQGAAYNADADRRSWEQMKLFFNEIFK